MAYWIKCLQKKCEYPSLDPQNLGNSGCPFFLWGLLAFSGLALLISLIFNIFHCIEKQRGDKTYRYPDEYIPRDDEYYVEDTPIYGNLDHFPEALDENCYEQMKARPVVTDMQEAIPSAQVPTEAQLCYASFDHSLKGKRRKPREQATDRDKGGRLRVVDTRASHTHLVERLPPESPATEENIHDDPVRLFGLIRAKRGPVSHLYQSHLGANALPEDG
uniref:T-cell receptor-associated transmembrane adapter 1 n=1 Tax=Jaculus jaculus TaxID=51337 RepID=UPI001E1B1802|nr:T-cell receptor-associated transmembrane adapter 1 [Jaculus jaculus]